MPSRRRQPGTPRSDAKPAEAKAEPAINVVLVGDIDCLYSEFFNLRARGEDAEDDFEFHFDNVPFVLNVLDKLAGDERFIEIRTRRPAHRMLEQVNEATEKAREDADHKREKFRKRYEQTLAQAARNSRRRSTSGRRPDGLAAADDPDAARGASMPTASSRSRRRSSKSDRDKQIKKTEQNLPAKSAACRTITSCGRCCCRRSSPAAVAFDRVFQPPLPRARGRVEGPLAVTRLFRAK